MHFNEYLFLVRSDLYRHAGNTRATSFLKFLLLEAGFKYSFWMRTASWLQHRPILRHALLPFVKVLLWHYLYKFGIKVSYKCKVGPGFYIGHFGGIFVNYEAVIGRNCNISQGVTIGQVNRGKRKGCPIIGDNVYIGSGAKLIGKVRIGNNVAIGANCVVTRDVPDNSVVVGIPCRIISDAGSYGYINNTDYPLLSPAHDNGDVLDGAAAQLRTTNGQ